MTCIQCSLTGTALDWYTNLHISYKQQWNSFVQLFKKRTQNKMRRYSDSDSPYLPPKYTSKNSTLQSSKKTHPNNNTDIHSQDYDPIVQNVRALPESHAKVFIKINPS